MADDTKDVPFTSPEDWKTPNTTAYTKILGSALRRRNAETLYRQSAYDKIAGQQRSSEQSIRDTSAQTLGGNNTGGMTTALIAQQRASAPYASADLAAREAGRQSAMATGQALLNKKQSQANWYSTMIAPYLHQQEIEAQLAIGMANASAAEAGAAATVDAAKTAANAQIWSSIIGIL